VWWADVRIGSGVQSIKISEMTYDELKALGVPASQRWYGSGQRPAAWHTLHDLPERRRALSRRHL